MQLEFEDGVFFTTVSKSLPFLNTLTCYIISLTIMAVSVQADVPHTKAAICCSLEVICECHHHGSARVVQGVHAGAVRWL